MNSFKTLRMLIGRHVKLYFKDKMTFFTSLLTPLILLVLFVTFLRSVYISSFNAFVPEGIVIEDSLINAFTGGWLMSSILGVSTVTIAFCSNIVMVQDRISGSIDDLLVTPLRKNLLAVSYYLSNVITTFLVCIITAAVGFIYLGAVGWYLSATDVLLIIGDVILGTLFGTSLAAVAEHFISSQGGISAVATLVSSMYGFLCGAYMPISQFAEPIRNVVSLIPGTYGTVLFRNHYMNGTLQALEDQLPPQLIDQIRSSFDGNVYFFGHKVEIWQMYAVMIGSTVILLGIYVLFNTLSNRKKR